MLSTYTLILLLCSSGFALGKIDFVAKNCDNDDNSERNFDLISTKLNSNTIVVPGSVGAAIKFQVKKARVPGEKYDLVIDMKRKFGSWTSIPCTYGVGSCTYDFCDLVSKTVKKYSKGEDCPELVTANNIPCSCDDIKPGVFDIPMVNFNITRDMLPDTDLAFGDYKVDIKIQRHSSKKEVGCIHLEFAMEKKQEDKECVGIFCDVVGK